MKLLIYKEKHKTTFITNEVWYSIKYYLKCIGNAIENSMHFDVFGTAKELLFAMTLILYAYYKLV